MAYKQLPNDYVLRVSDGAAIPPDPENRDYAEYLAWCDTGNAPALPDVRDLDEVKAEAFEQIDRKAGALRLPFISAIPGQEATYLKKEAEAQRWIAADMPNDPGPAGSYPYAEAESALTGATVAETLLSYAEQAEFMDGINVQIEAVRIHTRARILAAATAEDVAALVASAAWPEPRLFRQASRPSQA